MGASQQRRLRSGLFPNRRYSGWTIEDVRRPSLAEAMTFAARYVAGQPQRTSPQAAMLLGWARDDPLADHTGERMQRELELQRWDKWQSALLAAKGLNDKLVATLPLTAEHEGLPGSHAG